MEGNGRRALVMGLGLFGGGIGATRWLVRKGWDVTVTDLRTSDELAASVAALEGLPVRWRLGGHHEEDFTGAELVVKNPAVKPDNPHIAAALGAGATVTTEILLFLDACPAEVVGVTGSNGKTTTAHMLHGMLDRASADTGRRVWLGGNMGTSLLDSLDSIGPDDLVVLELSSFQLMDVQAAGRSPRTSAVTNITPNHLDWHRDLGEYVRAKAAIFAAAGAGGLAVLNEDDGVTRLLAVPKEVARLGVSPSVTPANAKSRDGAGLVRDGDSIALTGAGVEALGRAGATWPGGWTPVPGPVFAASDVCVPGEHNVANAACAAGLALAHGATPERIVEALRGFRGVAHRLELAGEVKGVRCYNDSIATTPESTIAALRSFPAAQLGLLLGGSDKGLSFDGLAAEIAGMVNIRAVALVGDVGPRIADALHRACAATPNPMRAFTVESAPTFDEAVKMLVKALPPGGVLLMSPACASFHEFRPGERFRNFEHRGEHFRELVGKLGTGVW